MRIQAFARRAAFLVALSGAAVPLGAQQTISGVVMDQAGTPLVGAQVVVEGTDLGGLTNQDGRFQISGVTGADVTLRVIMMGYRTELQNVRVGDQNVRIIMESAPIDLEELVVTGTAGGAQRRAVANSVARVRADEITSVAPVQGIDQLLNGRAPGVVITPPTGAAGGGSRILIRGRSSISLPIAPLIYVDGVRVDNRQAGGSGGASQTSRLNDLDPETIESIEVIKGPAAATLYGTEASNGVIQIITKKGRPGETRIDVSMRQGAAWFSDPEGRWPINYYKDPSSGQIIPFNLAQAETDRGTPLFRTGYNQGYSVSVSGGTDVFQYYAGGSYDRDEGATPENVSERYNARLNFTASPSDKWDANAQLGVSLVRSNLPLTWYMFGSILSRPSTRNTDQRGFFRAPAEIEDAVSDALQNVNRITTGAEVRHSPTEWLNHRLRLGIDISDDRYTFLTTRMTPEQAVFYSAGAAAGSKSENTTNVFNTTVDYSANGTWRLSDAFSSTTTAGLQYYRKLISLLGAQGLEFPAPDVTSITGAAQRLGTEDEIESITVGVFGQQQFSWRDRFFLTAAIRGDDNSAFGEEFDFVTYPKVSASWVISEEPFWDVSWVDNLRLRVAWGKSGQQPDAFAALRTFQPITAQGGSPGVTPQFVGNPELGPEKSSELELGFETSLLDNRLAVDFTFFNQNTKDAIILRDVAPSSGFPSQQFVNAGEVKNRGAEVLLNARLLETETLDWDATFSLSRVNNEVVSLGIEGIDFLEFGFGNRFMPGYSVYSFFAKKVISADQGPDGRPINIMCDGGKGPFNEKPGGPPVDCGTAPRVFAGKADPDTEGTISSSITLWDRVTLSGLVDFKFNQHIWTSVLWCPGILDCEEEVYPERYDPRIAASTVLGLVDDHRWIRDLSFWKFRELSLSYRLPVSWVSRMGASRGSISVAGRNLYTWTGFDGLDPENMSLFPEAGSFGTPYEQNEVPQLMQFVMRVNLSF